MNIFERVFVCFKDWEFERVKQKYIASGEPQKKLDLINVGRGVKIVEVEDVDRYIDELAIGFAVGYCNYYPRKKNCVGEQE